MEKYNIYCTPEQTKKALKLGAPIEVLYTKDDYQQKIPTISIKGEFVNYDYLVPTTEQMIGWLEEQEPFSGIHVYSRVYKFGIRWHIYIDDNNGDYAFDTNETYLSRKEATIAAIDAALAYLNYLKSNI